MATKYVSALDGGQMDSALMDMATHTSEAWAEGTRNGTPVSSGDVTYNNNAKYYANSASSSANTAVDAAARAEAAVPPSTAGAVFFDRAQSLTTAQQMQAKANISAGGTNPNLLDNPWFTVNQRSAATLPVGGYGIDRWKGGSAGAVTVVSNGLQFVGKGNAYQIPPSGFWDSMMGKTVTASLLFSNGTIQGGSGVIGGGVTEFGTYNGVRIFKSGSNNFNLESDSDANCIVRAVKLELGSVSTLANDVPPDYATELAKCQYYFRRFTVQTSGAVFLGWAYANTGANFPNIIGGANMRVKPTATFSGSIAVRDASGTDHAVTSLGTDYDPPCVALSAVTTGLTANTVVRLRILSSAYIDLSADL